MKISIHATAGGFMNHVRWLCLLDKKFIGPLLFIEEKHYESVRGVDWPKNKNELLLLLETEDDFPCKDEIINLGIATPFLNNLDKLKFILAHVYNNNRSWHNWLSYEWTFREKLNDIIHVSHNIPNINNDFDKILALKCDSQLAYKCYVKLNSGLNNCLKETFLEMSNKFHNVKENEKIKLLSVDMLFNPFLDKNFYYELIDWFELEDNYSSAQIIHNAWYTAHKRAEKEIVQDLTELYKE